MVTGFWGRKIGMTQIFANDQAIPVTAIRTGSWIVMFLKTKERDGYDAVLVGCLKNRHLDKPFLTEWLKKPRAYFSLTREVKLNGPVENMDIGTVFDATTVVAEGDCVDVIGTTKGIGFTGVVKRYNFGGPPGSHGSTMGKRPGSIGSLTACGKVIKGKKMPGHAGNERCTIKNLEIVKIGLEDGSVVLVKGSVPGKTGSPVFVRKV